MRAVRASAPWVRYRSAPPSMSGVARLARARDRISPRRCRAWHSHPRDGRNPAYCFDSGRVPVRGIQSRVGLLFVPPTSR
jgi:hypothetical protein